ncbi:MAG: hypothetical protein N4A57_06075 [Anaeromicrobium sp.]|uniref:hypothetical protein n=1 Tax=Anaeromicrobium sp. TaxID=1929132 RepID=UPI0025DE338D|nr:hypothetical protein [Anaeromicrobium sp.]MCT4593821.1 hypothetical protein [Anaeromicrobium sp.]
MSKIIIIFINLLSIIGLYLDFIPKLKLYLKFKSIFQLGEVLFQFSQIIFLIGLLVYIIFNFKYKKIFLLSVYMAFIGSFANLILDIYNDYFTFKNMSWLIGYVLFYFTLILIMKKRKSSLIHICLFFGTIGTLFITYEEVRSGIFEGTLFTLNSFYPLGILVLIFYLKDKKVP